jgi:hypothetical protein
MADSSSRTPEQIRASIETNRVELGKAVEQITVEVSKLTDWRAHLRKHQREITIGAAVAGFVIGGGVAGIFGLLRR